RPAPGCARSPGIDVSPERIGGRACPTRHRLARLSGHLTASRPPLKLCAAPNYADLNPLCSLAYGVGIEGKEADLLLRLPAHGGIGDAGRRGRGPEPPPVADGRHASPPTFRTAAANRARRSHIRSAGPFAGTDSGPSGGCTTESRP